MGITLQKLPPILDPLPGGKHVINGVDYIIGWARANSLWPLVYGTSCCAIEMMSSGASHQDWSRFGVEVARATPRQADLIILAGTLVEKLAPRLVTLYEQMPAPKYVIAMGSCTISGGPFYYDSYSVVKGADRIIPVDVYIPGCPPRPEALLFGIMKLQELIKRDSIRNPSKPRPLFNIPFRDEMSATAKAWEIEEKKRQETIKEAQEKFKAENPGFKHYQQARVIKPEMPELPRTPRALPGKPAVEIFEIIKESFPTVALHVVQVPAKPAPPAAASAAADVAPAPAPVPLSDAEKIKSFGPEYVLDLVVTADLYVPLVNFMKRHAILNLDYAIELTAVDWKDHFDVVVHLLSTTAGHKVFLRCPLPHDEHPEIPTLSGIYRTLGWHEREVFDLFGIRFAGHADLRRIFLEDEFTGHPLRKDFSDPSRVVKRPY